MFRTTIFLIVFFLFGCTHQGRNFVNGQKNDGYIYIKPYKEVMLDGEYLYRIEISIDCVGVEGIKNLPDFWTTQLNRSGEGYLIKIYPDTEKTKKELLKFPPVGIDLIGRGLWSDCMGGAVKYFVVSNNKSTVKEYRLFN